MVTLWLGGEQAANDHKYLEDNKVRARFSVRGYFAADKTENIVDLPFFKVDDIFGYNCSRHMAEVDFNNPSHPWMGGRAQECWIAGRVLICIS